ncbi:MAG: hypothetical protein IRY85_21760 [Micromonosporaceae bacterium]|nr:hypothetical protein [Micromonosporaceae bacterium]
MRVNLTARWGIAADPPPGVSPAQTSRAQPTRSVVTLPSGAVTTVTLC